MTPKYSQSRHARRQKKTWRSLVTKIAPMFVTGFGFVAFAMILPSATSSKPEARIFTQGLSIQIDRSSPAYAALEDTLESDIQPGTLAAAQLAEERAIELTPAKPIVSGVVVAEPVALKIERATRREESLLAQERAQRLLNSQALVAALSHALPTTTMLPASGVGPTGRSFEPTSSPSSVDSSDLAAVQASGGTIISNGQILTTTSAVQSRIHSGGVVNQPTKTISQADAKRLFGALMEAARQLPPQASRFPATAATRIASLPTAARIQAPAQSTQVAQESLVENQNPNVHQVVISGPVEFTGGIAITSSNDRIVIYRELDEEKLEPAQVWPKDARYEVFVDQPVGRLVGELRSVSGEVMGRGYYDLARLPKLASNTYRVDKISMMIGPVPHGLLGSTVSASLASEANPSARSVPVKGAHIQLGQLPFDTTSKKDGTFKDANLGEGSLVIMHADRPGHWGTLGYATAGSPVELAMFSDATVRAIMSASTGSDHENERSTSLIWGRVTRGGHPAAGAHVDLMTADDAKPVYFNKMMLPDATLTATSDNGLYAFFPVTPGSHAVQAADSHGVTEPSLFPTDMQTVTQVNLELAPSKSAKLRLYDAFKTDWPLEGEVISAGRKRGALVPKSGEATIKFTGGAGVLVLDADAGSSYDRIRVVAPKSSTKIDFPMVQTLWIDRIKGAMRINADPHSGTVVGFVRGAASYQVSLESESLGANTRILYFDARGEMTSKNYGEAGGGFLMLNVPQGFRTILVQPPGSIKPYATAILIEDRVTNVINKSF